MNTVTAVVLAVATIAAEVLARPAPRPVRISCEAGAAEGTTNVKVRSGRIAPAILGPTFGVQCTRTRRVCNFRICPGALDAYSPGSGFGCAPGEPQSLRTTTSRSTRLSSSVGMRFKFRCPRTGRIPLGATWGTFTAF